MEQRHMTARKYQKRFEEYASIARNALAAAVMVSDCVCIETYDEVLIESDRERMNEALDRAKNALQDAITFSAYMQGIKPIRPE